MADIEGADALAQYWWAVALRGGAAIAFGIIAFLLPGIALLSLVILLAAYLVTDAVFSVVAGAQAVRRHEQWWPLLLEGVLDAAAAVVALLWPGLTALALTWTVAVWAIFTGVTGLMAANILTASHGRSLQAVSAILSILLGVVMIALPLIGMLTLVYWLALYAVLFGIFQAGLAFRLHRRRHSTQVPA